jgi:hypothetical protein
MNDLLHHVLLTISKLFSDVVIVGLTKPDEKGDSEIVYYVEGDVSTCRGLAEVAAENLKKEEDEKA